MAMPHHRSAVLFAALALGLQALAAITASARFANVDKVLTQHIKDNVYPGCVAGVIQNGEIIYMKAFGNYTYGQPAPINGDNPPMEVDTLFDLASLTKVTTTTSCLAEFYQRGELDLDMRVSDPTLLGPAYDNNGKGVITVRMLLLHDAGYPPDPVPGYSKEAFGCPATSSYHVPEVFSCSEQIFQSLLKQTLINVPGNVYVYSDLSMITAQYIVGTLAKRYEYIQFRDLLPTCQAALGGPNNPNLLGLEKSCYYEAYARKYVFTPLKMSYTGFLPPQVVWNQVAPTWIDDYYRHKSLQGQVSDENSYALGGIAGHAGVFSRVPDLLKLVDALLDAPTQSSSYLNSTTVKTFTTVYNLTQSSRALGWDTNSYSMNTYRGCGNLSSVTFTHLGYTGTQICADPTRNLGTVLLTNRCYPVSDGEMTAIRYARRDFNNAVLAAIDPKSKGRTS